MSGTLSIWTVYDHPLDFPEDFVARRFAIENGGPIATRDVFIEKDLEELRDHLRARGLIKLMRNEDDQPQIMESWI